MHAGGGPQKKKIKNLQAPKYVCIFFSGGCGVGFVAVDCIGLESPGVWWNGG